MGTYIHDTNIHTKYKHTYMIYTFLPDTNIHTWYTHLSSTLPKNGAWYSLRGLHIRITWFSSKTKWYGTTSVIALTTFNCIVSASVTKGYWTAKGSGLWPSGFTWQVTASLAGDVIHIPGLPHILADKIPGLFQDYLSNFQDFHGVWKIGRMFLFKWRMHVCQSALYK